MFGGQLVELAPAQVGDQMLPHDLGIAVDGARLITLADHVGQPAFEILLHGQTLGREIGAGCLGVLGGLEFFDDLLAGLAVQVVALAFAVDDVEIDRRAPAAIRPLADRPFTMSASLCHGIPPFHRTYSSHPGTR